MPETAHALRAAIPGEPARAADLLWLGLALLLVAAAAGFGLRDPWPADEPRFAVIARDMVASSNWLFPRVGGDLYQDKPPLFFWLISVAYALTRSLRLSFLLPSMLAAGASLYLVYDLARRLHGREAGLAAALTLACTLQFVLVERAAQIDGTLFGIVSLAVYGFLRHLLLGPAWRWYAAGAFAAGSASSPRAWDSCRCCCSCPTRCCAGAAGTACRRYRAAPAGGSPPRWRCSASSCGSCRCWWRCR